MHLKFRLFQKSNLGRLCCSCTLTRVRVTLLQLIQLDLQRYLKTRIISALQELNFRWSVRHVWKTYPLQHPKMYRNWSLHLFGHLVRQSLKFLLDRLGLFVYCKHLEIIYFRYHSCLMHFFGCSQIDFEHTSGFISAMIIIVSTGVW